MAYNAGKESSQDEYPDLKKRTEDEIAQSKAKSVREQLLEMREKPIKEDKLKLLSPLELLKQQEKNRKEVEEYQRLKNKTSKINKALGFFIPERKTISKRKIPIRRMIMPIRVPASTRLMPTIIRKPMQLHPEPIAQADIDTAFNADINHAEGSLFGNEQYYYEDDFVNENFFGNEFDTDVFTQLNLNPRRRVSPLLW